MLMASGLNHGVIKTVPHFFGIVVGFPLMVAAIGLGFGAIILNYPVVYYVIKVFGIAYLVFLSWKIANAGNSEARDSLRQPFTFAQALAFQWINPKAWVIAIGAIATYTTIGNVREPVIVIIAGYTLVGSISMALWLVLGAVLQKFLRNPKQLQLFNIVMAILLIASVFSMIFAEVNSIL